MCCIVIIHEYIDGCVHLLHWLTRHIVNFSVLYILSPRGAVGQTSAPPTVKIFHISASISTKIRPANMFRNVTVS